MPLPRISVVIPANNAAQTLGRCLQALAQSEIAPFECLVVDDASADTTPEIARRLGARVLTIRRKQGPARARNRGARAARGDIIFFVDSDVCVHPETLSRLSAKFEKETGMSLTSQVVRFY
jgi:glycosyltransferase involved in cell wall biosynthesis